MGIICALEVELKDLLAELRDREDVVFNGYEFHCGRFGEIPAVLVQCGVGKVNAARGTQMLIDAFGPCCVINSGIAGGTKPGLAIGDIVIGKDLAQHDFDVTAFGYALGYMCTGENSNEPTRFTAEPVLVEELEQAARTLGARDSRIIWKHIFPNSLGTIITSCALVIPGVINSESMLSYLGIVKLGSAGSTSLGTLLSDASSIWTNYPHLMIYPALILSLLMICFNLFGNGLRDAFNPSLRGVED